MIEKICFFTTSFGFNRQTVLNSIEKLFPKNIEISLFTPKEFNNSYKSKRTKIVKTSCNKYNSFLELRKFCKKNKIQRIANLGVLPQEAFIMAFASIFQKTDFICFQASDPKRAFKFSKGKFKIKVLFETLFSYIPIFLTKKILFCSKEIYNYSRNYPFLNKKSNFLHLLIDTTKFNPKNKITSRKKLNLPLNKDIIIFVGRIEYLKGSDILYKIIKKFPNKLFILVGDINDKKFKNKHLSNLHLIGSKEPEDLIDYYNASDLCIFPSRMESYGFVPRESMSCEIPTLVSNINPLNSLKPALKSNLNPKSFALKINEFFKLPKNKKDKISQDSRNFIIKNYSEEVLREEYVAKLLG